MSKATTKAQLRAAAERSQGFTADVAAAAAAAIEEVDGAKADKAVEMPVTIPTTGWGQDQDPDFPKYFDITAEQITAEDQADVIIIGAASLHNARLCGFSPDVETLAGKIRVRAQLVPAGPIGAKCQMHITEGEKQ